MNFYKIDSADPNKILKTPSTDLYDANMKIFLSLHVVKVFYFGISKEEIFDVRADKITRADVISKMTLPENWKNPELFLKKDYCVVANNAPIILSEYMTEIICSNKKIVRLKPKNQKGFREIGVDEENLSIDKIAQFFGIPGSHLSTAPDQSEIKGEVKVADILTLIEL